MALAGEPAEASAEPETVVRQFMVSVLIHDNDLLRAVVIPTDPAELDWLMRGEVPPPQVHEQIREFFSTIPIERLGVGDKVALPQGGELTLGPQHVNADRMQLMIDDAPLPTTVIRIRGQWRVDPRPLIAARKAAAAHRAATQTATR